MDKRLLASQEMSKIVVENKDYSFGEVIYSLMLRLKIDRKSELLSVSDDDFYSALWSLKMELPEDKNDEPIENL